MSSGSFQNPRLGRRRHHVASAFEFAVGGQELLLVLALQFLGNIGLLENHFGLLHSLLQHHLVAHGLYSFPKGHHFYGLLLPEDAQSSVHFFLPRPLPAFSLGFFHSLHFLLHFVGVHEPE